MRYEPLHPTFRVSDVNEDMLDAMDIAYQSEHDRWFVQRLDDAPKRGSRYQLIRNSSPNNDICAEEYFQRITFTKRECAGRESAEGWLDAFAGRAAMRKALEALGAK